jgi:3-methylfumaryl-CoA hydratase
MIQTLNFHPAHLSLRPYLGHLPKMIDKSPRTQTQSDLLDPARAQAWATALGQDIPITKGTALPPFFHQLYFWDPQPPAALGRDGHPKTGGFIPDMGLPRRMWAAGRLAFHQPLRAGVSADRHTTIESVTRKDGRSGPLAFVRIRHDIRQRHALALSEWQELVYRADPAPDAEPPQAPLARTDETDAAPVSFSPTLLFRYSALTFNGHRIHYDAPYAREVEGYSGLVVHGPLLAQLLMLYAEHHIGPLKSFNFRATSPLTHDETATLCWNNGTAWVRARDGRQCMIAEAL